MAGNANFSGWNPRDSYSSGKTFSDGNFTVSLTQQNTKRAVRGPSIPDSGKWYIEFFIDHQTSGFPSGIGVMGQSVNSELNDNNIFTKPGSFIIEPMNGQIFNESTSATSYTGNSGSPSQTGDADAKVGIAIDRDANKLWFAVNNTWVNVGSGVGDPANGNNPAVSSLETNLAIVTAIREATGTSIVCINCGQDSTFGGRATAGGNADSSGFGDFFYTPPTDFLALSSANYPVSADIDPAQTEDDIPQKQFNAITYTGDNSTSNAITGLGFQPDLVWIKQRSSPAADYSNVLFDTSRGRAKVLYSQRTDAEPSDSSSTQDLVSFDSDGFTVGTNNNASVNGSSKEYVAWCWRANGGTTASNSEGSTTCTVQANTKGGFSMITYSGTGSAATLGHGLEKAPEFIMAKRRSSAAQSWKVYNVGLGATKYLTLNATDAVATSSGMWNDTAPSTTLISIGNESNVSTSGLDYIIYAWHSVEGYSKFGSFEGNNTDNDGPFVYTGFRPRMICIKGADEAYGWYVFDSARNTFNLIDKHVAWNYTNAELTEPTGARKIDFLSNGFKVMADEASINGHSDTYVYMAWGDVPFKYNNTF